MLRKRYFSFLSLDIRRINTPPPRRQTSHYHDIYATHAQRLARLSAISRRRFSFDDAIAHLFLDSITHYTLISGDALFDYTSAFLLPLTKAGTHHQQRFV